MTGMGEQMNFDCFLPIEGVGSHKTYMTLPKNNQLCILSDKITNDILLWKKMCAALKQTNKNVLSIEPLYLCQLSNPQYRQLISDCLHCLCWKDPICKLFTAEKNRIFFFFLAYNKPDTSEQLDNDKWRWMAHWQAYWDQYSGAILWNQSALCRPGFCLHPPNSWCAHNSVLIMFLPTHLQCCYSHYRLQAEFSALWCRLLP